MKKFLFQVALFYTDKGRDLEDIWHELLPYSILQRLPGKPEVKKAGVYFINKTNMLEKPSSYFDTLLYMQPLRNFFKYKNADWTLTQASE